MNLERNHLANPPHVEPYFGIRSLETETGNLLLDRLSDYLRRCGEGFPSYDRSLELINRVRKTEFVDRMVQVEIKGSHTLFSHSLFVGDFAIRVADQLNNLFRRTIGVYIVDTPLLATSAYFHDIGNLINHEDIEKWGLNRVDISPYVVNYPPWLREKIKKEGLSHILKTCAFLEALGFPDHAHTSAHSMYHLLVEPVEKRLTQLHQFRPTDQLMAEAIQPQDVTIERLLLMLADFSVVSLPKETGFPQAAYATSLAHKMDQARSRHAGELGTYIAFHDQLQVIKSYIQLTGVVFPPDNTISDWEETDEESLRLIEEHIKEVGIIFSLGEYQPEWAEPDREKLISNLSPLIIYLAQRGVIRRSIPIN